MTLTMARSCWTTTNRLSDDSLFHSETVDTVALVADYAAVVVVTPVVTEIH